MPASSSRPDNADAARLLALHRTGLLDRPTQDAFDRLARLAQRLLDVPVALVSLVDGGRQFFTGQCGLPAPVAEAQQTPLSHSFCKHVVDCSSPLAIADARTEPEFKDNGAVRDLDVVAYLGVPLKLISQPETSPLGALCAIDHEPRDWTKEDEDTLTELAALAVAELELRLQIATRSEESASAKNKDDYHRLILDSTAEGIFGLDKRGHFTFANRACLRLLGCATADELSGKFAYDFLNPRYYGGGEVPREDFAPLRCAREGVRGHAAERCFRRVDGSHFAVEYWAHPARKEGQDTNSVVTFVDITQRLDGEEHNKRLAQIVEVSQDLVGTSDKNYRIISLNRAGRKMIGVSMDYDVSTLVIGELHTPESCRHVREVGIPAAIREGSWLGESVVSHSSGRETPVSQLIICHKARSGEVTHFSTVARDISEQKAENSALRKRSTADRRASHEKSRFLANMSHEIRTPLNAVLGFGELLEPLVAENPQASHFVEGIRTSGRALLDLINDLLDLSKIEAGQLEFRPVPSSVHELADALYLMFDPKARKKGIDLEIAVAENVPDTLLFDQHRVRQILINLVGNAVKFTDEGTVGVRFEATAEENTSSDFVTLTTTVSDTGPGIDDSEHDLLFTRFTQTPVGVALAEEGTGLGLSISQQIADAMGGAISFESTVGSGTVFTLTLPHVPTPTPEESAVGAVADDPAPHFSTLPASRILAADDNAFNRTLIESHFSGSGHEVIIVKNGEEARKAAREHSPDIVLMDLRMPVLDGVRARAALAESPLLSKIPVLAVTASSLIQSSGEIRDQFDGYIRKPFTRSELFHAIAPYLQGGSSKSPMKKSSDQNQPAEHSPQFPTPPEGREAAWRGLSTMFSKEAESSVPGLRASMAFGEITDLAKRLESASQEAECPPATEFASELGEAATTFQHATVKEHLDSFSNFAENLAKATSKQ